MADISTEITAFKNAAYGEDVRNSLVSLANKLNNGLQADITSLTDTIGDAVTDIGTFTDTINDTVTDIDNKVTSLGSIEKLKAAGGIKVSSINQDATGSTNDKYNIHVNIPSMQSWSYVTFLTNKTYNDFKKKYLAVYIRVNTGSLPNNVVLIATQGSDWNPNAYPAQNILTKYGSDTVLCYKTDKTIEDIIEESGYKTYWTNASACNICINFSSVSPIYMDIFVTVMDTLESMDSILFTRGSRVLSSYHSLRSANSEYSSHAALADVADVANIADVAAITTQKIFGLTPIIPFYITACSCQHGDQLLTFNTLYNTGYNTKCITTNTIHQSDPSTDVWMYTIAHIPVRRKDDGSYYKIWFYNKTDKTLGHVTLVDGRQGSWNNWIISWNCFGSIDPHSDRVLDINQFAEVLDTYPDLSSIYILIGWDKRQAVFEAGYTLLDYEYGIMDDSTMGFFNNIYTKTEVDEKIAEYSPELGTKVFCWGDSLTAGAGSSAYNGVPYPTGLGLLLTGQYEVVNRGVGGETTKTILGRQGAMAMIVQPGIIIPGDKSTVECQLLSDDGGVVRPLLQANADRAGLSNTWINDIPVTLSVTMDTGYTNVRYYLRRVDTGDPISIDRPTPLKCSGWFDKSATMIMYIGQNGGYSDISELIEQYKKALDHHGSNKYILLGLTSSTASARAELESQMFKNFGRHYINLRAYMSTYAMDDYGLIPTETDTTQMAQGMTPDSLRIDGVHGNAYYYDTITRLIFKRGLELGYWEWTDEARSYWEQTIIR